ncbi:MAG: NAD(P)/FAD-dependent oxidoreductase [Anaerolineales bacterium]
MNIAIIGAGYAGMSAAYDLVKAGHKVTIYEAAGHPGGLAAGFKEDHWDWSVEVFYHHWFQSDAHMLGLIDELGLRHKVLYPRPLTVMMHKGRWYPFDSIPNALLYPGLGWGINKVRFGLVGLYLKLSNNWRQFEKVTVDEWMRKWAGDKVYREMWEPLVIGKFGEKYAKQVNMAWMWARIKARTSRLGTYQGGFQAFADDFAGILADLGVNIKYNAPVKEIVPTADQQLTLKTDGFDMVTYDKVLSTTSPKLLSMMAPSLPESYLQDLLSLKSMGAVVLTISMKHQLSKEGYYWFNMPKNEGFPFLALVEHTNYVSPQNFGGEHILYAGDYLEPGHEYFSLSKEELLARFLPAIQRINPEFNRDWVLNTWVYKAEYAQPVPLLNHSQHIPEIETPLEGLYFASMSQVYPWDRGTNFAVEIGRRAARMMMED